MSITNMRKIGLSTFTTLLLFTNLFLTRAQDPEGHPPTQNITLSLQSRDFTGSLKASYKKIDPKRTAVIVVDMWDQHWCKSFSATSAADNFCKNP